MMYSKIDLNLKDGNVCYFPNVFTKTESDYYFNTLLTLIKWKEEDIKIFGKTYKQPRLTALYANNSATYSYSNIIMKPNKFIPELLEIKQKIENITNVAFTSCLLNLYRDGNDSNGWHADDEKELGKNPIIASVTFGAERVFCFKHKQDKTLKQKLILEHGSLLLMQGNTQHNWQHQLPKTQKKVGKRINLTFRIIKMNI